MNAISALYPYKHEGLWVFDDPAVGLRQESFVFGIDKMIDQLVSSMGGDRSMAETGTGGCRNRMRYRTVPQGVSVTGRGCQNSM